MEHNLYEPWGNARAAKDLALETRYSSVAASINEPVTCDVVVSRPSFQGYGMMIAEIGLPPGAEVDRGTLASILNDPKSGVDSFEVAPDHVTFYVWPRAADSKFRFVFRPRFAMRARTAQSVLYDYFCRGGLAETGASSSPPVRLLKDMRPDELQPGI